MRWEIYYERPEGRHWIKCDERPDLRRFATRQIGIDALERHARRCDPDAQIIINLDPA